MATLTFGEKAVITEKHPDFWDINCRYAAEHECITQHLKDQAVVQWKQHKNNKALEAFGTFMPTLNSYAGGVTGSSSTVSVRSRVKDKVIDGSLRKECPPVSTIVWLVLAVLFTISIEFSVLMVQSLSDNPFIIVFALILAAGGVCQGIGFGNLYYKKWLEETKRPDVDRKKYLPFIVVGSIVIVLVAGIRGFFGGPLIFFTTLVLGLLVCVAETFHKFLSARRKQCLHDLEQAQMEQASEMHRVALDKNIYFNYYKAELNMIDGNGSTNGNVEDMVSGGVFS